MVGCNFRAWVLPASLALSWANPASSLASETPQTVSILAWPTSFSRNILDEFTEKTGIRVIVDNTPSDEFSETKVLAGKSGYDVINITAHPYVPHLVKAGAIEPLLHQKVPNLALQDKRLLGNLEKPEERSSIALYYWGTTGIGLSSAALHVLPNDVELDSSALVFNPVYASKLGKCGLTFLDSPTDVIPLALLYLGFDPDNLSDPALEEVVELFENIRPFIRKFDSTGYKRALAQGDICAAVGWSEAVYLANESAHKNGSKNDIKYILPREGGLVWTSGFVIPKDAPHRQNAEIFVNFAISREAGADLTQSVKIASAVPSSRELLSKEVLENPITFPREESNLHYFKGAVTAKDLRRMNRAWSRIKYGK